MKDTRTGKRKAVEPPVESVPREMSLAPAPQRPKPPTTDLVVEAVHRMPVTRPSVFTNVIVRSRAGDRGPCPETFAVLAGGTTHILKPEKITIWFCSSILALYPLDPWISGSAQPKLTKDNLGSLKVWVPPLDEQRQIEASVKKEAAQLQQGRQPLEKNIEVLEEYRSAVITAAVTGQLAEMR